jgi:hypothetical protein
MTSQAIRIDVLKVPNGWLVTDSRAPGESYLSSAGALVAAKAMAQRLGRDGGEVEVYLSQDGREQKVELEP